MLLYARICGAASVVRLAALATVVVVLLLAAATAAAAPGDVGREFSALPTSECGNDSIGLSGGVAFDGSELLRSCPFSQELRRVNALTGASSVPLLTEFPLPTAGGFPEDAVGGPDGSVWYTVFLGAGGKVGRITPSGSITEWSVPGLGHPWAITVGPDGNLWFTIAGGVGKIGRITPEGVISELSLPTMHAGEEDIAAGPDGNLWYVEGRNNGSPGAIGRITPAGAVTEFNLPAPVGLSGLIYSASHITAGPDGNLWFTALDAIGRITPAGAVTFFRLHDPGLDPAGIVSGADGNLWFAETGAHLDPVVWDIGRITPSGQITEFPIASSAPLAVPLDITSGPDGAIWFTDISSAGRIGRMTVSGVVTDLFPTPTPASRPQGLTVGSDGALWFVEEEANRIARLPVKGVAELLDDLAATLANLQPPLNNGLANQFARRLDAARQYFADDDTGLLCSELADFKDAITKAAAKNNPKMTLQQADLLNAAVDGVAAAAGC